MDEKYQEACSFFPAQIRESLLTLPQDKQKTVREICLRAERPLIISAFCADYFLSRTGCFSTLLPADPYLVSRAELSETVKRITEYSLHSFQRELNEGFVTVRGGHRAGLAGSAAQSGGGIVSVTDIGSLTLRVARQVIGAGEELCRMLFSTGVSSTLLAGAPASGKTTLLRDMTRCLSDGLSGKGIKISLIDERGELAAVSRGVAQNNVGVRTDVFDGYPKGEGMAIAVRSMTPRLLVVDEIATERDAASIRQGLNAGAAVIATVHAASMEELHRKKHICSLLAEGAFRNIVLLKGAEEPCRIARVVTGRELVEV